MFKPKKVRSKDREADPFSMTFKKRIGELHTAGKLFVVCGIASIFCGWGTSYFEGEQTQKSSAAHFAEILQLKLGNQDSLNNYKDSIRNYKDSIQKRNLEFQDSFNRKNNEITELERQRQVARVQQAVDSANNRLTSKNFQFENLSLKLQAAQKSNEELQKNFNSPRISQTMLPDGMHNPSLTFDSTHDRYQFSITVINSGKGVAQNLRIESNMLYSKNGTDCIFLSKREGTYTDKYMTLDEESPFTYIIYLKPTETPNVICLEIKYANSFNEERSPFRNIYFFDQSLVDQSIPVLNRYVKENVENYLLFNKIWKN